MTEIHPFGVFVPPRTRFLLLGSFTTKTFNGYEWFYANGRNQFWPILEEVYKTPLKTKTDQQKLFTKLNLSITDIILECERINNSNLDTNLKVLKYNDKAITKILRENPIVKIFFTSRFVEKLYRKICKNLTKKYPEIELVTLPSPSPRYAQMSKDEKIENYKILLPKLKNINHQKTTVF